MILYDDYRISARMSKDSRGGGKFASPKVKYPRKHRCQDIDATVQWSERDWRKNG